MRHRHEGLDLRQDHARATLEALLRIWHRPACVLTVVEGKPRMLRYDGSEHSDRSTYARSRVA